MNVVGNALDAVGEVARPKVLVGTLREPADGSAGAPPSTPEGWVRIVVKDNGSGVPPERAADIFRPFVSTKGSRGTGLGLAVSRKILREHGGDIIVQSVVGKGSLFTLRLPLRSPLGDGQSTQTEMPVAPPLPD